MAKASPAPRPSEQAAWHGLRAQLLRYAEVLKPFLARRPPALDGLSACPKAPRSARAGLALKRLGREDMRDFLRVLLMNVADLLDEQLRDDRLKGLLAFDAVLGAHLGPRSPTSLLACSTACPARRAASRRAGAARGGMGAVAAAVRAGRKRRASKSARVRR